MQIVLHAATDADFDLLYDIKLHSIKPYVEQVWGWDEQVQKDFLRRETPVAEVSLIYVDGRPAGFIQLRESGSEIFVGSLFLREEFQQKGIGTHLLQQLSGRGKTIRLEVLRVNTRALGLYLRLGFKITGETDIKYLMEKKAGTRNDDTR